LFIYQESLHDARSTKCKILLKQVTETSYCDTVEITAETLQAQGYATDKGN